MSEDGIIWKKAYYKWTGVTNPTRAWWMFWKPRKANILLTFHYYFCDQYQLKMGDVKLEIAYD